MQHAKAKRTVDDVFSRCDDKLHQMMCYSHPLVKTCSVSQCMRAKGGGATKPSVTASTLPCPPPGPSKGDPSPGDGNEGDKDGEAEEVVDLSAPLRDSEACRWRQTTR